MEAMRLFLTITMLFASGISALQAQSPDIERLIEMGDACIASEDFLSAQEYLLEALPLCEKEADYYHLAYLYLWLSETAYYVETLDTAMHKAMYALQLAENHLEVDSLPFYAAILQNIGFFCSKQGDLDAQMNWYRKAHKAAINHHGFYSEAAADAYLSLGAAFGRRGDWSSCISLTDTSLQIAEHIGFRDGISSALLNLAYSFAEKEDYQKAVDYQSRALDFAVRQEEKAKGLNNLGAHYIDLGYPERGVKYLEEALVIRKLKSHELDRSVQSIRLNIARSYIEQGAIEQAKPALEEAIGRLSKMPEDVDMLQIALNYKAKLFAERGELAYARTIIEQALKLEHNYWPVKVSAYLIHAEILMKLRQYDKALESANKGLQYQVPDFVFSTPYDNPPWQQMESVDQGRSLLKIKGDILRAMGVERQQMELLLASMEALTQGDALVMQSRRAFNSQRSKDLLASNANELYSSLLSTLYELHERTANQEYFDKALICMEQNKALSILENLNSLYASSFSDVPAEVVEAERQLLREIEQLSIQLKLTRGAASSSQVQTWEQQVYQKRRSLDSLLEVIALEYPKYYQMKHDFSIASSSDIEASLLDDKEVMMEYFVQGEQVFVLLIDEGQRHFFKMHCPDLQELCAQLRVAVMERKDDFYTHSYQLYKYLVEPLDTIIRGKSLLIIPDDILAYIPFELLITREPTQDPKQVLQKEVPYLLINFPIRYLFSANTALQSRRSSPKKQKGQVLAMAPFFDGRFTSDSLSERQYFDRLPGAQLELDSLEQSFKGKYWRGAQASEANFKRHCMQAGVLHIATHTLVNDQMASASYLLLGEGKDEDGKLHAYELYNLQIGAELAVLSGCNTGVGKLKKGEGSASLAHAFAYAGCPNLVMSLWPVRDKTTPVFMSAFYKNMQKGKGKAESLRQAKLFCLKYDDLFAHPYYWSGFLYVGEDEPVALRSRIPYLNEVVIVLLVMLLGLFILNASAKRAS
jgi:CHAT domain-containing protein/Tfp pilus assembly protein PilF